MSTMTIQYCLRCADRLSLIRPSTESEIQLHLNGKPRVRPVIPKGTCEKCGQAEGLTYYQFPG